MVEIINQIFWEGHITPRQKQGEIIFIVVPSILKTLKFLSSTYALRCYTYKMLKYTFKISYDCSYMFRSTWTIIREPMPNLVKVNFCGDNQQKYVVKCSAILVESVSSCGVYCVPCSL